MNVHIESRKGYVLFTSMFCFFVYEPDSLAREKRRGCRTRTRTCFCAFAAAVISEDNRFQSHKKGDGTCLDTGDKSFLPSKKK